MKLSSSPKLVTIFGGSGFIGRHAVRALAERGFRVRAAVRRPDLANHLQPLGNVGQIHAVQANLRYRKSVDAAVKGADVVINLVGTFDKGGRNNFDAVHVFGAKAVAEATRRQGARLVHMSAIGADVHSPSGYGKTKGKGEAAVKSVLRDVIILRPSVVFGPEDEFFNRFAAMAQISPFLPLIGGGKTKFQPVYVGNVAEAIAMAADGKLAGGKTYELGGPEVVTFRECMQRMLKQTGRSKMLVSLPWFLASTLGSLVGWLPGAPITSDQVEMLKTDNLVSLSAVRNRTTLEGIGIPQTAMAAILPSYLVKYRPHGQFTRVADGDS